MNKSLLKMTMLLLGLTLTSVALVGCGGSSSSSKDPLPGSVRIVADSYPENAKNATVIVEDATAAGTAVEVTVSAGAAAIADLAPTATTLSVDLDDAGRGAREIVFGTDLLVVEGDTVTASYANADAAGTATITAAAPVLFGSDDNLDGKVYLYATNESTEIDFDDDTMLGEGNGDFLAIWEWSGTAVLEGNYKDDATFEKIFAVTPATATGWSSLVYASGEERSFADDFMTDLTDNFSALHFKFKGEGYSSIKVAFVGANEVVLRVSSAYAADLGDGWYSFSLPLEIFGDLSSVSDIGFITEGTNDWFLTDIYFDDAEISGPPYTDLGDDGKFYIKSGDGSNPIDLEYGSAYTIISVWDTNGSTVGAGLADVVDATYGEVWEVATGNGWGVPYMGVLAFAGFDPLFATNFTTLNFKYKLVDFDYVNIVFSNAGTAENGFDLATYGTQIGTSDWYEVSAPLAGFGSLGASTEFAFKVYGGAELDSFQITDIYFE